MINNQYDNEKFFNDYQQMRSSKINANELIEIPMMKSMLPDLKDKIVLDLGCGAGEMSKYYAKLGAKNVLGLDISTKMIDEANKNNNFENVSFKVLAMENLSSLNEKFDIIISSLAFHYIEDFEKLMHDISNLLNNNGILLFSQEHPIATAPILNDDAKKYITVNDKRYYLISDYNTNAVRTMFWNNDYVPKYHRNFSSIVNAIVKAGLMITEVQEPSASKEAIALVEKYKFQNDRPYFIFFKARKN